MTVLLIDHQRVHYSI